MGKTFAWGGGILVILVLAAGGWYWSAHYAPSVPDVGTLATSTDSSAKPAGAQHPANPSAGSGASASASGSSDPAVNSDLNSIDSQMSGFNSDDASVDSGLNDQQVQQSSL